MSIIEANFKRRQYKKDIMASVIDEWDPLVVTVKDIKSEVGIDVEDGGDIKKTATNNLEPTFHDEPTVHDEQDPAYSSFVGHLTK